MQQRHKSLDHHHLIPQLFPLVEISIKTLSILHSWAQISHFLVTSQMRSKDALILLHQPLAVWVNVCLVLKNLTIHTKIVVYDAVVISTILYGCETWVPYRHHIRLLESFHIRRLQLILGIHWWHKVTHSEIRSRAGIPTIESILLHRQLRWLGHVIRMPHSRLPHCVLYGQLLLSHRSVGGQKKRFNDHIKSILKKCNIPFSWLENLASNRSTCAFGMSYFDDEYDRAAVLRCSLRHQHAPVLCPIPDSVHQCSHCGRQCYSCIGLLSHSKTNFQRWRGSRRHP